MRVGDSLRLEVRPGRGVTIQSGTLKIRPPWKSLHELQQQFADVDLDRVDRVPDTGYRMPAPWRSIRLAINSDAAAGAFPFDGPDGIYEGRVRISAVTDDGERLQRERSFHILVDA